MPGRKPRPEDYGFALFENRKNLSSRRFRREKLRRLRSRLLTH
jgi:hypothetical protein